MSGRLRDHTVEQNWSAYTEDEHAIWRLLFERQQKLLKRRACREYLEGLQGLGVAAHGIPDFRRLSDILDRATGWRIAPVPGSRSIAFRRATVSSPTRSMSRTSPLAMPCR